MKRIFLSLPVLSLVWIGCSHQAVMKPEVAEATHSKAVALIGDGQHAEPPALSHGRQPGDFVVYRFSGSYRSHPVTVTERVVARDGDHLLVDVDVAKGGEQQLLRLRVGDGERQGDVVSVAKREGNVLKPYGVAAYEKLMNDIVLSADSNEGEIGATGVLVDVGNGELSGTRTSYKVRVGAHEAIMSSVAAEGFAWGDVSAEIRTEDGKLLYQAEVIDMGGPGTGDDVIAVQYDDELDAYDDLEF
jgi:uncharacterized iron-regulated membrane protein